MLEVNYICGTARWCWLSRYLASRPLEKPYGRFSVSAQQEGSDRCFHSCEELPGCAGSFFSATLECLKWAFPVHGYTASSCYNTSARNTGFLVVLQCLSRQIQPYMYKNELSSQDKPSSANISLSLTSAVFIYLRLVLPDCRDKFVIDKR